MLRNSQCDGWVVHRRGELAHEFRYRVWMLLADSALLAGEDRGRFGRSGGWSALQLRA
jgi:hypothetical protein